MMKVIYGIDKIKRYKKPVVALGVFDGVHRGHRQILNYSLSLARRIKGTSIAFTFWPHPHKKESLYSLRHRIKLISETGIDVCIIARFNKKFSALSAVDFVKNILTGKIGANYVCVGKNFHFGRAAQGNVRLLERLSMIFGFKLKVFHLIRINGHPVSSTSIRNLISKGNIRTAEKLLGRPVSVFGTVVKGAYLSRRLGFPSANINLHHEVAPPPAVYAAKVILDKKKLNGICYIADKHIEAHIFNFKKNIYGKDLEVQFVKKIRNKINFSSRDSLAKQIKKDILAAKKIFSRH